MQIEKILKAKGIKVTPHRINLVRILLSSDCALQPKEIENKWKGTVDRVTLYRNLKKLTEKNVIHKIEVNELVSTYHINNDSVGNNVESEHLHFHCVLCDRVVCMPQCTVRSYELPNGFTQKRQKLIIEGICKWCNENH
jgi:Fur family ferric uptake transcriptional regulator